jgi:uncharacterized protein YacL
MKLLQFLMNPVFSESVTNFFLAGLGNIGIILLGFLKMFLIFAGSFILTIPALPIIINAIKKYFGPYIQEELKESKVIGIREYIRKQKPAYIQEKQKEPKESKVIDMQEYIRKRKQFANQ